MNHDNLKKLKVLDCTFRDGGHINNWQFDQHLVRRAYRASSLAGVDYFEIGYRVGPSCPDYHKVGPWARCDDERVSSVIEGMISGARPTIMVDYGRATRQDFIPKTSSPVAAVRVATYRKTLGPAIEFAEHIGSLGYEVFLNLMAISHYSPSQLEEAKTLVRSSSVRNLYFADSFGSLFPEHVSRIISALLEIQGVRVGFHAHNNMQMAFANCLTAAERGASYVDASIYGMGRGVGNLPLEILISYLQDLCPERYNALPLLEVIRSSFVSMHQKERWGYSLAGLISAVFDVHPSYCARLLDHGEFLVEDLWNVMRAVSKIEDSTTFSRDILQKVLQSGKVVEKRLPAPTVTTEALSLHSMAGFSREGQVVGQFSETPPGYVRRHEGRPFLILANGPSLRSHRDRVERFIQKYNPVILGNNNLGDLFIPHYHVFTNRFRFFQYVGTVHEKSQLMLADFFETSFVREQTSRTFEVVHLRQRDTAMPLEDDGYVISVPHIDVAVASVSLAVLMGAKAIFVAGMDGYQEGMEADSFHFYRGEIGTEDSSLLVDQHKGVCLGLDRTMAMLDKRNRTLVILTPTSHQRLYRALDNYLSD